MICFWLWSTQFFVRNIIASEEKNRQNRSCLNLKKSFAVLLKKDYTVHYVENYNNHLVFDVS